MSESAEADLKAATQRYRRLTDELEAIGIDRVESLTDAVAELDRLLDSYEDRATGTGDFTSYLRFRKTVTDYVEDLPDQLPHRDVFEAIGERMDKRRLAEKDFTVARERLDEARSLVEEFTQWQEAKHDLRDARRDAQLRIDRIDDRIDELDRLLAMADLELNRSLAPIHDPIEQYHTCLQRDFQEWLDTTPAIDVLDLFALTDRYPLVSLPAPPAALYHYVQSLSLSVPELLTYADFSRSKLDHYVDDPGSFKANIATERTYLESITHEHFRIDWPPPPAPVLQWIIRELRPLVDRFATEETVACLRSVASVSRDTESYAALREIALARDELTEEQRNRLASGDLTRERESLVAERERLTAALETGSSP